MKRLSADFHEIEFCCPDCGKVAMNPRTIKKLQELRDKFGKPISIVPGGGWRCDKYAGRASRSAHRTGEAVDPGVHKADLYEVIRIALEVGFTGIGIKNHDGKYQLHLDDAKNIPGIRPRPWIWTYK